jgi:hypothetical protein
MLLQLLVVLLLPLCASSEQPAVTSTWSNSVGSILSRIFTDEANDGDVKCVLGLCMNVPRSIESESTNTSASIDARNATITTDELQETQRFDSSKKYRCFLGLCLPIALEPRLDVPRALQPPVNHQHHQRPVHATAHSLESSTPITATTTEQNTNCILGVCMPRLDDFFTFMSSTAAPVTSTKKTGAFVVEANVRRMRHRMRLRRADDKASHYHYISMPNCNFGCKVFCWSSATERSNASPEISLRGIWDTSLASLLRIKT